LFENNRLAFFVSTLLGGCIWKFSETLSGAKEPWDGNILLYLLQVFCAGLAYGLLCRSDPRWGYFSTYIGQFLYGFSLFAICLTSACQGGANLFPIGAIFLLFTTLPAALGSYLGFYLKQAIRKTDK